MSTDAGQTTLASADALMVGRRAPSTQSTLRMAVASTLRCRPHTTMIPWRPPYLHRIRVPHTQCIHLPSANKGSTRVQMAATPSHQIPHIALAASRRVHHMAVLTLSAQGTEYHRASPWGTRVCNMDTTKIPLPPTAHLNRHQCSEGRTTVYRRNSPGSQDG